MSAETQARTLLSQWLGQFALPAPTDPHRALEEAALEMLQNLFVLVLAATDGALPSDPKAALRQLEPNLKLSAIEFEGRPSTVAEKLGIGDPDSDLFTLQERLLDSLNDERRGWLWQMGQMY